MFRTVKSIVRFIRNLEANGKQWHYAYVSDPYFKDVCHLTDGNTLGEAVYMAHDLLALLATEKDKTEKDQVASISFAKFKKEAADDGFDFQESGCSYIGSMDIEVTARFMTIPNQKGKEPEELFTDYYYVNSKSSFPLKKSTPFRFRMLERAYKQAVDGYGHYYLPLYIESEYNDIKTRLTEQ